MPNKPTPPKSRIVRWSPTLAALPALSVRQPMAWFIVAGFKDIENRGKRTHYRGPVLIHAGLNMRAFCLEGLDYFEDKYGVRAPDELPIGGIVGVADIVDCAEKHRSKWFRGPFAYVLANPRRLAFRPCKGQLGLFKPTFDKP